MMKRAVALVIFGFATGTVAAQDWLSDWIEYDEHFYRMTTCQTWSDAEAQANSVGAHLVTINDAAENQWLLETMIPYSPYQDWGAWMGLYQPPGSPEPDGGWIWISGEPLTFLHWAPNEPNGNTGEMCGELYGPTSVAPGMWNDLPNDGYTHVPLPGIVEIPEPTSAAILSMMLLLSTRSMRRKH